MRLIPIAAIKLIKILEKAGFKVVRQDGSHLRLINPYGRSTTVPIHGSKEISPRLLKTILKEANIGREEFSRLLRQVLILLGIMPKRDSD
ncbi:MAG: type II toxin-antitoxin system HicA family toxin [Candidatus Aenigmarchaeota archaeon]|nr:type II toxin-antitoxin system HicA family toxin [Candidatus Aenigmarchaeota archaeon]